MHESRGYGAALVTIFRRAFAYLITRGTAEATGPCHQHSGPSGDRQPKLAAAATRTDDRVRGMDDELYNRQSARNLNESHVERLNDASRSR
jgi:hypothetical protein